MRSSPSHPASSIPTDPAQLLPSRAATPKVLLAEDDHEMRMLLLASLPARRYKVLEVGSGLSLFDRARQLQRHDVVPDLIITDVRMPGMDGLDVVRMVRRWGWKTPTLLVTAFPDDDVLAQAKALGVTRVFGKPFDLLEFADVVQAICRDRCG